MDDFVELGRATGSYGFRGWVRVQPTGTGEVLKKVKRWRLVPLRGQTQDVQVEAVRVHGAGLIAKWVGCDSKEAADALKGTLYVARADFPAAGDDAVWAVDLIGMQALNTLGETLGRVVRISSNGVQDLLEVEYEIAAGKSATFMVPMVKDVYLVRIDLEARCVVLDWQSDWR